MIPRVECLIKPLAGMVLAFLLCADNVMAQSAVPIPHEPGMTTRDTAPLSPRFLLDEMSHMLVGVVAAAAGILAHRAWSRRRWRRDRRWRFGRRSPSEKSRSTHADLVTVPQSTRPSG